MIQGNPRQVERFLKLLKRMDTDSQRSFRKIYGMAPGPSRPVSPGSHVRLAMTEAIRHPDIAYWVRLNLALRVARKFSETAGLHEQSRRYGQLLDDFHEAADAFIKTAPIPREEKRPVAVKIPPATAAHGFSDAELQSFREFKQRIIPGLVDTLRRKYQRKSPAG